MTEAEIIAAARRDLAGLEPGLWSLAADGEGEFVEALGPMGELLPVCRIDPGASFAERSMLVNAVVYVRALLGVVDRAVKTFREMKGEPPERVSADRGTRGKDYAAQAAMLCDAPAFLRFLADRHGLEPPLSKERAAQKVRSICGVGSRKEFNDAGAATAAWKSLAAQFENWKRAG